MYKNSTIQKLRKWILRKQKCNIELTAVVKDVTDISLRIDLQKLEIKLTDESVSKVFRCFFHNHNTCDQILGHITYFVNVFVFVALVPFKFEVDHHK